MKKLFIVWGEENTQRLENKEYSKIDDVRIHDFETDAELIAFIEGVHQALSDGMPYDNNQFSIITEEESKLINSEVNNENRDIS